MGPSFSHRKRQISANCLNGAHPWQQKFKGPLEKTSQKNTVLPFVFLLGNHSSGKSSFINYVLQRKVQTAGVAPTDDFFTVIVPGPADVDRDGPSFIGDPDMGFSGLRSFGPHLVHRTKLKVRSNISIKNFMIVDTPGMIDSPMIRDKFGSSKHAIMDRGYDFEGVTRWFAERADVILLFFDPDKPGTTGETLSILTNALVGQDHKLHIILNKADQFKKIHDFARAYGSLCWNLSKVIQRKDLPHIYTMCLPKTYQVAAGDVDFVEPAVSLPKSLADLEEVRENVVQEVMNAPKRRVDNEITRLTDSVALLQMHMNVIQELARKHRKETLQGKLTVAGIGLTGVGSLAVMAYFEATALSLGVQGGLTTLLTGIYWYMARANNKKRMKELMQEDSLVGTFKALYAQRSSMINKDEYLSSLWARVHDHLQFNLAAEDVVDMDKVRDSDLKELEKVVEVNIPSLRRKAAPVFHKRV